jgi:hypothetical protein
MLERHDARRQERAEAAGRKQKHKHKPNRVAAAWWMTSRARSHVASRQNERTWPATAMQTLTGRMARNPTNRDVNRRRLSSMCVDSSSGQLPRSRRHQHASLTLVAVANPHRSPALSDLATSTGTAAPRHEKCIYLYIHVHALLLPTWPHAGLVHSKTDLICLQVTRLDRHAIHEIPEERRDKVSV